jgi:hypothetical protein
MFYKPKSIVIAPMIIWLVLCVMQMDSFSQNGNIWVFGDSSGINFNQTPPIPLKYNVKSRGTSASYCNSNGDLMFYTAYDPTGMTGTSPFKNGNIYNSAGAIMQNGDLIVMGLWYQEAIIIPNAIDSNLFYLFTIGVSGNYGLYYSIIDLSQNNGLGAVTQKNVQLLNKKSIDCICAVKHGNGRDWWLFFKTYGSVANNDFYKYLISPSGISGPFMQSVGVPTSQGFIRMVMNKQGDKMALINYLGMIELFDFDRCIGWLNNYVFISPNDTISPYPGDWSGEFSPDGSKLYISTSRDDSYLFQFNLNDSIPISTVDTLANLNYSVAAGGALKLAPDNKIYWSCAWSDGVHFNYPYPDTTYNIYNMNLSVINSPDSLGAACDFQPYSFYLGGGRTYWGLPNNPNYDLGPLAGSSCDTLTVGLNEISAYKNNLAVYYDYGWQMAFVNAKGLKGKNAILKLFNLNGQLISTYIGTSSGEYFTADVNMQGLPNGMYIFQLSTDREVLTGKVVKS